jgi:hypothetical protein
MKINGNLQFHTLGDGELQNAIIERLTAAPTGAAGRLYYDTGAVTAENKGYWYHDGTTWIKFASGGNTGDLLTEINNIETSLGPVVNDNGTFNVTALSTGTIVNDATSITNALLQLDAAIVGKDALSELVDVALGSLVDNDVLQYNSGTGKWENVAIGSASGVQPYDLGLVNLATGGTGIVVQNGDTAYWRSLTAPAAGITITNPNGVADNPTFALANDLAAVEGLITNGIAVRTADDTWATRTITGSSGLNDRIVVTNGDGVGGQPTIDLGTLSIPTTGASGFWKFDYDTYGRVTKVTAVATSDITALVDATYVNVAGDTMDLNANITFNGGEVLGLPATPSAAGAAASKAYVDSLVSGLSWKDSVRALASTNITLSGTQTVDGVSLVAGDRVLVTGQTTGTENGIYVVAAGSWTRATYADPVYELEGAAVFVQECTAVANTGWTQTADGLSGFDGLSWSQFSGGSVYVAGVGINIAGNMISARLGAGIFESPDDEIGVEVDSPASYALSFWDGAARDDSPPSNGVLTLFCKATGGIVGGRGPAASNELRLAFETLPTESEAIDGAADYIAFYNNSATAGTEHQTATFNDVFNYLDVPYGITTSGIVVRTGDNVYASREIVVSGAGAEDGLKVTNGDGISGNPTIGLDITGTPAVSALDGDEEFVVYNPDDTANRKTTLSAISTFVQSDTTLDELSDVDTTGAADGSALVFDGTNWVDQKIYHLHSQTSDSTSWTVTHDIGQKYCNVTVVDTADEVIIPQSITFTSTTALTITFNTAIQGKAVVMGVA